MENKVYQEQSFDNKEAEKQKESKNSGKSRDGIWEKEGIWFVGEEKRKGEIGRIERTGYCYLVLLLDYSLASSKQLH